MDYQAAEPQPSGDEDPKEAQLRARRQFTYSMAALQAGITVDKIFVTHSLVTNALNAIDRTYQLAQNLSSSQGMTLVGPTGSGKTTLAKYFRASLPSDGMFDENTRTLYMRLQERPAIGRLITAMLRAVRYPFSSVTEKNLYAKRDILIEALRQRGTILLFLDEAHYLCDARRSNATDKIGTAATDLLRELIDEVPIAVVLIGDESLDRLPEIDSHLASRTPIRMSLSNFDTKGTMWMGVVKTILSKDFGVGVSALMTGKEILRLHAATGGNMRQLKWLVSEMVMVAVDAQQAEMRIVDMSLAFDRLNGSDCLRSNPWSA
ncbi:TniB family NTP-binding protein [Hydrogenophaga sp.]|uniref:TniB family NTP-binding protein n=1 Tax=Hydrogenophaga sp. TaxID=1904254 RepID=UPI002FC5F282